VDCQICHGFGRTFGGHPMAQYLCDLMVWELVLNNNPQVRGIVELGTYAGGFSWFLDAQARARGISFDTYDIIVPDVEPPGFTQLDFYRFPDRVELGDAPVILLCDGGNKPRELRTFPPMCAPGSVVVAHDWGTETLPSDVPDFLEELYGEFCDSVGSVTRVFRMKGETWPSKS
jgi:hypothetical protein